MYKYVCSSTQFPPVDIHSNLNIALHWMWGILRNQGLVSHCWNGKNDTQQRCYWIMQDLLILQKFCLHKEASEHSNSKPMKFPEARAVNCVVWSRTKLSRHYRSHRQAWHQRMDPAADTAGPQQATGLAIAMAAAEETRMMTVLAAGWCLWLFAPWYRTCFFSIRLTFCILHRRVSHQAPRSRARLECRNHSSCTVYCSFSLAANVALPWCI
jgi:hypothetical protein